MRANRLAAMAALSMIALVGATASPALAATGDATVEELVVTAQKRGEKLQSYLHTEIGTFFSEDAANPAQSLTATTPSRTP